MSDKKRTTVTTIETREVWIIRKAVPGPGDETVTIAPQETAQLAPDPTLCELNNDMETDEEESQ